MDPVVLGLSVAIAVVVVLLLSCWDGKAKKPAHHAVPKLPKPQPGPEKSDWGTGVKNREMANRYNDLANLAAYEDYGSVAQYMSVEPEVFESHARYSEDMGRSTSGASALSVRDDPNDVVPWVGLRRPDYRGAYSGRGVRQDHSEIPDQMPMKTSYCL